MKRITKEHYRDFIGSLAHKRAEVNTEMKALEHAGQRGEWDFSDEWEYNALKQEFIWLTQIQEYFFDTDRWGEFASLENLKQYVEVIKCNYKGMGIYSRVVLPEDGGKTVGVTQKEWEWIESTRWHLKNKVLAWSTFAEFCEFGKIL